MSENPCETDQTRFFFDLTPDKVLDAVEASGLRCTGRCFALNSFENRVYDVELEKDSAGIDPASNINYTRIVVKFYRPGRWSAEQILEEHEFLRDLKDAEIPAIAPLPFSDGLTLHYTHTTNGIAYALFPKVGGRAPEEMSDDQLRRVGRLLGRMHNVGAQKTAKFRLALSPTTYGWNNLRYLLQNQWIPIDFQSRYQAAVEKICKTIEPWFEETPLQRIHGDCHLGNLLWSTEGPFVLDFDDMVRGPTIQDLWLLAPGRDEQAYAQRDVLLEGYREMRKLDQAQLRLIEPLRALRFVHYTAWVARRWEDPAFPLAFPHFWSHQYWKDETEDLEGQLRLIS